MFYLLFFRMEIVQMVEMIADQRYAIKVNINISHGNICLSGVQFREKLDE